ncbi:hypothetical protein Fmac_008656 [Flemingia macrophylla]|uniref:Uncharacterized protein n=1 Tax=Flemingia macrophylla TaxID=520843 RepID=A0ABD1MY08_9FABA
MDPNQHNYQNYYNFLQNQTPLPPTFGSSDNPPLQPISDGHPSHPFYHMYPPPPPTSATLTVFTVKWHGHRGQNRPEQNLLKPRLLRLRHPHCHGHPVSDGVYVISLSIGVNCYAPHYFRDSIVVGAFDFCRHDVLVFCSTRNSGLGPFTTVNIALWILTVGPSTINREFSADVVLRDGRVLKDLSLYYSDSLPDFKLPLVYAAGCGGRYCYMGSLESSKVQGKIVVCDRRWNARVEKGS